MAQPSRDPTVGGIRPALAAPREDESSPCDSPPCKTDYVRRLEREVERKIARGELPCGPTDGQERGFDGLPARPIDFPRKDAKIESSVVENDEPEKIGAEANVSETATAEKPANVKKSALDKKAKKSKSASKKAAKKAGAKKAKRGTVVREQTCINIPVPAKKLLDAKCKKLGKKRNRVINELIFALVGYKPKAKKSA